MNTSKLNNLFLLLIVAFNMVALLPLLSSGYIGDDLLNSSISGEMINTNTNIFEISFFYIKQWFEVNGRIFPLALLFTYPVFYIFDDLLAYKAFVICMILVSLLLYRKVILTLSKDNKLANMVILLFPLLYQFRFGHDPILAYNALYPFLVILLFSSVLLSLKQSILLKITSLFLYLCACLTYEVMYPFCVLFTISFYIETKNINVSIIKSSPYFIIAVFLALFSYYTRGLVPSEIQETYQISFDITTVIFTYLKQTFAAIPFSYAFFDPNYIFKYNDFQTLSFFAVMITVLLSCLTYGLSLFFTNDTNKTMFLFALCLFFFPALLISLSSKFQTMKLGETYLPVYISYFGVSLMLALTINKLITVNKKRFAKIGVFALLIIGSIVNAYNNEMIIYYNNFHISNSKKITEDAIENKLMDHIPSNSKIFIIDDFYWHNSNFYAAALKMKMTVFYLNGYLPHTSQFVYDDKFCNSIVDVVNCKFGQSNPAYLVGINSIDENNGSVELHTLSEISFDDKKVTSFSTSESIVYVHDKNKNTIDKSIFSVAKLKSIRIDDIIDGNNDFKHLGHSYNWDLIKYSKLMRFYLSGGYTQRSLFKHDIYSDDSYDGKNQIHYLMEKSKFTEYKKNARYDANLTDLILFSKSGLPSFLQSIVGMSGVESWGRWSDSKKVIFTLTQSLPENFSIYFSGMPFGPNAGEKLIISIGNQQKEITLQPTDQQYRVNFTQLTGNVDKIEFTIPKPISPSELGLGQDVRKLGFGFKTIKFDV